MENLNCCSPNEDSNSACCPAPAPIEDSKKMGMKKNIGKLLMGLAVVIAISSAFKTATGSGDIGDLPPAIDDFEWMQTEEEVAYVLLKGDDKEENNLITTKVEDVVFELNSFDESVAYYELDSTHQHYHSFIEEIGVEATPSVVVLGRGGNLSLLSGVSISSLKLLKAHITATTPAASCSPTSCTPAQKAKCSTNKSK